MFLHESVLSGWLRLLVSMTLEASLSPIRHTSLKCSLLALPFLFHWFIPSAYILIEDKSGCSAASSDSLHTQSGCLGLDA